MPRPSTAAAAAAAEAPAPPRGWWVAVALLAMAVAGALSMSTVWSSDGDVTTFLRVGRYAAARPYVERSLPGPVLTEDYGHDGQQFYVVAGNVAHLTEAAPYVDRLRYRARRILFPALVAPVPEGTARVWAMWGVNLLCVGASAVAFGRLAQRIGVTPWFGLVAGLSPALLESLNGSLGDGLAFTLALWGVVLWRRHLWAAAALFTLAALGRETALVAPLACLVLGDRRQRLALLVPFAVFGAWAVTIMATLPATGSSGTSILSEAANQLTAPFAGWVAIGMGEPGPTLGWLLLLASVAAAWLLRRALPEVAVWLGLDLVLLVLSSAAVVERPMNLARVAPLALPALVLAVLHQLGERRRATVPDPVAG